MSLLAALLIASAPPAPSEPLAYCAGRSVFFAPGSAVLDKHARRELQTTVEAGPDRLIPSSRYRIVGTADPSGSSASNLALARRRAEALRDYLVAGGYPPDRLFIDAQGEIPLRNPKDPVERAAARAAYPIQEASMAEWRSIHGNIVC